MIVGIFALIGALLGISTARRRKGTAADVAQYSIGFGVAFGVVGLVVALILRAVVG
ncbi:MAG: hypothetical protein KJO67_09710 [Silicimonas sp.]|nr:hypothetical protein [Silicimonas sp.]